MGLFDRFKSGWNAFLGRDPTPKYLDYGASYPTRPDRVRFLRGHERSIINSVYNRIAIDASTVQIKHARLDDNERFVEEIKDPLNNCFTIEANIDQTSRSFLQDVVMSLLDEGCVAIVPVDTSTNPYNGSYDILSMRTAKIVQWYPQNVRLRLYNDRSGREEEITLPKALVAIVENPFYSIMNEPSSTLQRLIRKLNLLDTIDEKNSTGKLDMIIQLPYLIKTPARKQQAEQRRKDIELQLGESKYGIAYTDGTEKITQLNRSIDNNMMEQVEYFTNQLYSQLGITQEVLAGTANQEAMLNYQVRTIEPIVSAIVDEMKRKFLTKTARSQKQSIVFYKDPFRLVPAADLAELADKFTRNEIMTSNEFRQVIGLKPSNDPKADELVNSNIAQPEDPYPIDSDTGMPIDEEVDDMEAGMEDDEGGVMDTKITDIL